LKPSQRKSLPKRVIRQKNLDKTYISHNYDVDPLSNSWLLSYHFLKREGNFKWPDYGHKEFENLNHFLVKINSISLEELQSKRKFNGSTAFKEVEVLSEAGDREYRDLCQKFGESFTATIYSFSYCMDHNRPERIYGIKRDSAIYLIWWDPHHSFCGGTIKNRKKIPLCNGKNFFHPSEI